MKRLWILLLAGCANPINSIRTEDYRRHIEYLGDPAMQGRNNNTPEGLKAADYVAAEMKRIGLRPGGTSGWFHDFDTNRARGGDVKTGLVGRNVVGILDGTDLKDEVIIVNAHHDGLGVKSGVVRPGADDNVSGVAMILELAEALAKCKHRRTIVFVSFDCEEDGLVGSREFVKADLFKNIVADVCFDLIGGNFYAWETTRIYALGAEHSPEIAAALGRAKVEGLDVQRAGIYLLEPPPGFARSDYGSFRPKKIPFVFFSTGTPWYYHSEFDTPENINYPKITNAGKYCYQVVCDLADGDARPTYNPKVPPARSDVELMKAAIEKLLSATDLIVTEKQKKTAAELMEALGAMPAKAGLDEKDRSTLQQAMILLFVVQAAQIKKHGK